MAGRYVDELKKLPFWRNIAFAARCARRVQPLTDSLPPYTQEVVESAIRIAEIFASDGAGATSGLEDMPWPADFDLNDPQASAGNAAALAADRARQAARAALYSDGGRHVDAAVADLAAQAAKFAETAVLHSLSQPEGRYFVDEMIDQYHSDIDFLSMLDNEAQILVDTSDYGPMGPLWPDGEPSWFASPQAGGSELIFDIEVPEGATDEDVVRIATELAVQADDLHRALGGRGLKVARLEVEQWAMETAGGPRG